MRTAPVCSAYARALTSASSTVCPECRTCAPYARVAATLGSGAFSGMKTVELVPSSDAASATPWALLPALAATTPRSRSAGLSPAIRTYAPRSLNDPVRWRFSHLSSTGPPTSSPRTRDAASGVTCVTPRSSSRAAVMSARVGVTRRACPARAAGP